MTNDEKASLEMQALLDKKWLMRLGEYEYACGPYKEGASEKEQFDHSLLIAKEEGDLDKEIRILECREKGIPIYTPADAEEASTGILAHIRSIMEPLLADCTKPSVLSLDFIPERDHVKMYVLYHFAEDLLRVAEGIVYKAGHGCLLR